MNGGIHYNATFVCSTLPICECRNASITYEREDIFCRKNGKMSHLYLILFEIHIYFCACAWEKATLVEKTYVELNFYRQNLDKPHIALNIKR